MKVVREIMGYLMVVNHIEINVSSSLVCVVK